VKQEGARREGLRKVLKNIDRLLGDRLEEIGFNDHNIVYYVSLDVSCYITHNWTSEQQRDFARYLDSGLQHGPTKNFQGLVIQPECYCIAAAGCVCRIAHAGDASNSASALR
jgi:hypothetical protein